jgi:nucleoside-diphosphate-sugar epimerase
MRKSGVRSFVIRAGDFFGSGKGTWFDQAIVKGITKGEFTYPGDQDIPTAWAYLPDLARTFVAVATQRAKLPAFETLHFAGHSITARDWMRVLTPIAQASAWVKTGESVRYKVLPWALIKLGGLLIPSWADLVEMRYLWQTPHRLDNTKLQGLLGAEPHTPLHIAAAHALRDLGLHDSVQTASAQEEALR